MFLGHCFQNANFWGCAVLSKEKKNVSITEKSQCKVLSIGRHLEISSLLLMSAVNNKTLTSISLKLCFSGFVHHHNELFFSYLWSFVHKFTSSSTNLIVSWWGSKNAHTLLNYIYIYIIYIMIIIDLRLSFCSCRGLCVQSNIFVARVLHFSAFITLVFSCMCVAAVSIIFIIS